MRVTREDRRISKRAFHHLVQNPAEEGERRADWNAAFDEAWRSTERFVARFPELPITDRSVLDYGCGVGATTIWLAEHGAERSVGLDIQSVDYARSKLRRDFPHLRGRVGFHQVEPGYETGAERFDLVISKDTFEHVDNPAAYVAALRSYLNPDGRIAIGFGPLWKSPRGGHISFMTNLPWAHLIFPEDVILSERRRFRPEEDATRFEEIRGGLNRMTLEKFLKTMEGSGLVNRYLATNRSERARSTSRSAIMGAMRLGSRMPPLREYCTLNVYSVWSEG